MIKSGGQEPDAFEGQIGQAILELEMNSDLKPQLRDLYITRAREIEFNNKKVQIIGSPDACQKSVAVCSNRPFLCLLGHRHLRAGAETEGLPEGPDPAGARTGEEVLGQTCCVHR